MIAKLLNWLTQGSGWKIALVVVAIILVLMALVTGIGWFLLISAFAVAPKALEDMQKIDTKTQKKIEEIDEKTETDLEEIDKQANAQEQAAEQQQQAQEQERLNTEPKTQTAKELENKILDQLNKND